MGSAESDRIFSGSIPRLYEEYLVPLIFQSYAHDLANRLASRPLSRVLEIAAGTGVVTRHLASVLPERRRDRCHGLESDHAEYGRRGRHEPPGGVA